MNVALCPQHLNILSICTGGAGLDLGVELAIPDARTVCMVEREAFAVAQLVSAMEAGLLAPAPIWSDARTFDGRRWRGCVDGLIGGIPCQPHSLAGRKRGSLDHRDLWSDARRIIVQSRARFVLIENVGGMLSAGDDEIAGAERVFRDLHKLGFEVEGGLFTAAEVGAPHQRERIFILAVANRGGDGQLWSAESHIRPVQSGQQAPRWGHIERCDPDVGGVGQADAFGEGLEGRDRREIRHQQPAAERGGQDLVDDQGVGRRERRPEPELRSWRAASAISGSAVGDADIIELRREPPAVEQSQLQHQHGLGEGYLFPPGPDDFGGWADVIERAPELEPAVRVVADELVRGIHGTLLDRSRVDQLRLLGNGVVPLQAAYAIRTLATRLARRGSSGAAKLVGMMNI